MPFSIFEFLPKRAFLISLVIANLVGTYAFCQVSVESLDIADPRKIFRSETNSVDRATSLYLRARMSDGSEEFVRVTIPLERITPRRNGQGKYRYLEFQKFGVTFVYSPFRERLYIRSGLALGAHRFDDTPWYIRWYNEKPFVDIFKEADEINVDIVSVDKKAFSSARMVEILAWSQRRLMSLKKYDGETEEGQNSLDRFSSACQLTSNEFRRRTDFFLTAVETDKPDQTKLLRDKWKAFYSAKNDGMSALPLIEETLFLYAFKDEENPTSVTPSSKIAREIEESYKKFFHQLFRELYPDRLNKRPIHRWPQNEDIDWIPVAYQELIPGIIDEKSKELSKDWIENICITLYGKDSFENAAFLEWVTDLEASVKTLLDE